MPATITREEVKAQLSRIGKTAADVGRELGVGQHIVTGVLAGRVKGTRGDAHKVAVALGLKEGAILADGAPISDAIRAAA